MTPDVRKLLAGYSSGTLSEQERGELFRAALADQQLFNALADEEGLRQVLAVAEVRGEMLAALDEPAGRSVPVRSKWPVFMGLTAGLCVVAAVVLTRPSPEAPQQIAQVLKSNTPAEEPAPAPQAALQADRAVRPEPRRERAPAAPAARPPAEQATPVVPAPPAAPSAAAEALSFRIIGAAKSAVSAYTVEQRDATGEWHQTATLLAGRETRLALRFPAAGTVTATDGEREIERLEVEAGTPVFIRVPSPEGERIVTVAQPGSGFRMQVSLRFRKP